jgi:hypothetical protein
MRYPGATAVASLGPSSEVTAKIDHEFACLPQLLPAIWWPLRQRRNGQDGVEQLFTHLIVVGVLGGEIAFGEMLFFGGGGGGLKGGANWPQLVPSKYRCTPVPPGSGYQPGVGLDGGSADDIVPPSSLTAI